ncbi:MAG: 2-keto-3-deoxy-L-fuconate dehydrogenase [Rhodothermales bacterium]|jgi:2-keto-3-deoxy-L-fuconate dehydrogenase
MKKLANKIALVTGGSSGIGRAIAECFVQSGVQVGVIDTNAEALADFADAESAIEGLSCDVCDQAAVDATFAEFAARHGRLDIVVNNAGISHIGTAATTNAEDFSRVMAVNSTGVYNGIRAAMGLLGKGGVILNMASIAATTGIADRFAYSASKGAVLAMTYSAARDCLDLGIRCLAISPARVHTPFVDGYLAEHYPGREAEMFEVLSATQPIGRMGEPWEIAKLAAYLCSDDAGFMTGTNVAIDGGFINLKA